MVEVVRLRAGEERQVISRVGVDGGEQRHTEPEPGGGHVTAQQQHPQEGRQVVGQHVFQRVGVQRRDRDGRRPLVVPLVNPPVQGW